MGKIVDQLFNLKDRVIVLAGGAGQIGFKMAIALADAGATVAIADVDTEMAEQKIREINDPEQASRLKIYPVDVSSKGKVDELFERIESELGDPYGLINCFHFKGNTRKLDTTSNFFAGFEDYPEEAWDLVHTINLKGTFLMSQAVIPYFKKKRKGVIVNISSTYGNVSPNKSIYGNSGINAPVAYSSSKAAIINLTRYIATHMAEFGIRANVLSLGGVYNNQSEEFLKNYKALTPLNRMATADEYQGAILFLLGDASSYMTGSNVVIDGGWTSW
jgi:NAD(P)-dependent dehydrogenase (short-subunit alcohol dehydrogenase family)